MISYNDSIASLPGVGPKKTLLFEKMGIKTIEDLLNYYPIAYQDRRVPKPIDQALENENILIRGRVISVAGNLPGKGRRQVLRLTVDDNTGKMEVVFFNAFYLKKSIKKDGEYCFYGHVTKNGSRLQMVQPEFVEAEKHIPKILPVYSCVRGISQNEMRKHISALTEMELPEFLPDQLVEERRLCPVSYMTKNIHFPEDRGHLKVARYRRVYEDLFLLQLGMEMMRGKESQGIVMEADYQPFISQFPFEFTQAQKKAVSDIMENMESGKAMNRLLQGDVGSGKTAVAATALYKACKSGYQAAFMAPTEILAKQHFDGLKDNFKRAGLKTVLLSGGLKAKEKRETLELIKSGEANIVIGTHALIQKGVEYKNLGLVVTDEQHRFGVNQRVLLSEKGQNPHILVMTATPIPRTLAVILYGDLDVSVIDQLPAGRKEIVTKEISVKQRKGLYEEILLQIKDGRQAYVVAPLIEDSEILDNVVSVESLYEELLEMFYDEDIKIDMIHGAMKQEEKDEKMLKFKDRETDILVATVVIEVGINVPNATVMVIENSERFGLSQLHQLRGRVGRGEHQSYCYLINKSKGDIAKKRMEIMCQSTDGFYISEKDMELRGPGEVFGTRQHGIPDDKLLSAVKHMDILEIAKKDAKNYVNSCNDDLQYRVEKMFGEHLMFNL